ncbi:Calcineurin-like phosphoesterase [Pyrenophora tritici-repentis]|nr:Calcineurin-like phosphoesterase [Pyrenophora tritici-repentis]
MATPPTPYITTAVAHPVVTDLTIRIVSPRDPPSTPETNPPIWHRIEKELYLHKSRQTAWLYVALKNEEELEEEDFLVTDIRVGESPPNAGSGQAWDSRPGGIWVLRSKFSGSIDQAVTEVDILFGMDAIDPRPQWALMQSSLQLNGEPEIPVARLSVLHGRVKPTLGARPDLRVRADGRFKIVQISDTHMVTGIGVCKDAIDAHGKHLPESGADPLTMKFIGTILDVEKPDLVVLTGDQLHHDIPDSQTALFKALAPIIQRQIPFAAVFGNHDSEGVHALSRTAQMSILENLPFSLCEAGPKQVDGVGNFYVQVLAPTPSKRPVMTLYFLDSHGEKLSWTHKPDYDPIQQSQIDWFLNTSQAIRSEREKHDKEDCFHGSLVFQHIPLPEFKDKRLIIHSGHRREPTEGPSINSHFYDALLQRQKSVKKMLRIQDDD